MSHFPATPSSENAKFILAIDLGTTTLAGSLVDLSGAVLAEESLRNPQQELGIDILTRLEQANNGQGDKLQSLLVAGLKELVGKLVANAGCSFDDVVAVAAAGNPGMSCLLCNTPVKPLLFPPHKPVLKEIVHLSPGEVDLGLPCPLSVFPQISGFVGGDLLACLFGLSTVDPGSLLIDLGTNAEIALWDGHRWWVTSAAAGPAFEAGNISTGMIHTKGAITDVSLDDDRFRWQVCGLGQPKGLCGSGLLALIAAAFKGGLIDANGTVFRQDEIDTNLAQYLVDADGTPAIRYYRDANAELHLTQEDVRNLQLAKGAVNAGVKVLLEKCGYSPGQVPQVYLTGALGINASKEALKRVALLPEPMVDKTSFIANGVLAGLHMYLASESHKERLEDLVKSMQPLPLSGTPAFEKHYLKSLNFASRNNQSKKS